MADDLLVVGLGVVTAGAAADLGGAAVRGQARPGVDGYAPALVVTEVQVQLVDLVKGQLVDVPLDLVDGEEVPGDVEHRAAPAVARAVLDGAARDQPRAGLHGVLLDGRREQLAQGLHPVEEPGGLGRRDGDALAAAVEAIALGAERALGQPESDATLAVRGHRQAVAGRGAQDVREVGADAAGLAGVVDADVRVAGEAVRRSARGDRRGGRDDPVERNRVLRAGSRGSADGGDTRRRDEQQRAEKAGRSVVLSHLRSLP